MYLRRRTINEIKGSQRLQKALALAMFIKYRVGRKSTINNYTTNKIRNITSLSASTINKYLPIMFEMGWARTEGKNNEHLVICRLHSKSGNRNIDTLQMCFDTYKDVFYSLRSFIALIIQAKKDFIRHTIQRVTNPKNYKEFMSSKKLVKRLVKQGILNGIYEKYKEYGLSYKRIAKEVGCCARTAFRVMQYAINNKWVKKERNYEKVYSKNVFYREVDGYTYTTKNYLYVIYPNTYSISYHISRALSLNKTAW